MSLRPLALLLALLPGLIAPVGMTWCTAWCTAMQATTTPEPATAKAEHGCCAQEPASKAAEAPAPEPSGPQFATGCQACGVTPAPKSELSKHELAAAAASLAPPGAAPNPQPVVSAPRSFVRVDFAPPSTAGPGCAPLPLRI